ncbi:chitinase [Trametes elegans]|nr:chitinase [Trametes elegans]
MLSFLYLTCALALPVAQAKLDKAKRTCSPATGTPPTNSQPARVATAWFAGFHAKEFPLENISWDKYTHQTYSFATTLSDPTQLNFTDTDAQLLPQFVKTAHEHDVSALVSVGGWIGSRYYSENVGNAENRTAFVKTLTDFVTKYELDGLDFDWEYPGKAGLPCNVVSPDDAENFLAFLKELRAHPVGQNLTLSAATTINPWVGEDGTPLADVSEYAKLLDWVAIMNYDIWGSWSAGVGPNAPLNDTCADKPNQQGSGVSAVAAWQAAGFPASQIVLGVAAYGHSYYVNNTAALDGTTLKAYPAFEADKQPDGDEWADRAGADDGCGNPNAHNSGGFTFWGLMKYGFLQENGTAAEGIDYRYDECSQTPYVYNKDTNVMVSFDNAQSFAAKGEFIKSQNLLGFAMWEAGGDSNDILLDSIRGAVNFPTKQ